MIEECFDTIMTKSIIHLLKSRQRCKSCEYWSPVFCLENGQERMHSVVDVSRDLHRYLFCIPTLNWGKNKSNTPQLFNHCEKCNAAFFDARLFHPGQAFMPLRKSQCEEMLIIELPITSPQKITGVRVSHANHIHLDHAKRITWKKYKQEYLHEPNRQ